MFSHIISIVLASHSLSLTNRFAVSSVNEVFKYNILHTVERTGSEFVLKPGEQFAFHGKASKTTNSDFTSAQGFKSDGFLVGDGVCHLASLMYLTALKAGLDTRAPVRHDFAKIPDIDREYGVSIHSGTPQNLYITNNRPYTIKFKFINSDDLLTLEITQMIGDNLGINQISFRQNNDLRFIN